MTDPVGVASLSLQLLAKTTEALNALRERAQRTKDIDIKDQINTLYDNVLALKEVVSRLLDENKDLQRQLVSQQHPPEKPKIRQVGETNYYFVGEEGPYCQPCFDVNAGRLVALSPQKTTSQGGLKRQCPACHQTFYERANTSRPSSIIRGPGRYTWG
jgi:hypothetical protein